jgi:hypothetical protein
VVADAGLAATAAGEVHAAARALEAYVEEAGFDAFLDTVSMARTVTRDTITREVCRSSISM